MSAQAATAATIEIFAPLKGDASAITARIDRLPENRRTWWLVALLSLAGMFEVYDLYQTAYIPAGLVRDGIFSDGAKGLFGLPDQAAFAASTFLGLFVGAIGFASVADRFGRRRIFVWALVAYSIATLAMALQSTANGVFICRFLAGIVVFAAVLSAPFVWYYISLWGGGLTDAECAAAMPTEFKL